MSLEIETWCSPDVLPWCAGTWTGMWWRAPLQCSISLICQEINVLSRQAVDWHGWSGAGRRLRGCEIRVERRLFCAIAGAVAVMLAYPLTENAVRSLVGELAGRRRSELS